jgi:hypothetical protein
MAGAPRRRQDIGRHDPHQATNCKGASPSTYEFRPLYITSNLASHLWLELKNSNFVETTMLRLYKITMKNYTNMQ